MNRFQAQSHLLGPGNVEGAFLVRHSEKDNVGFVLSGKTDGLTEEAQTQIWGQWLKWRMIHDLTHTHTFCQSHICELTALHSVRSDCGGVVGCGRPWSPAQVKPKVTPDHTRGFQGVHNEGINRITPKLTFSLIT